MPRLRIVAQGKSDRAKATARGKLFESITAQVLRRYGYEIDEHHTNVTHAGMEIDVEGKTAITSTPVYAECKCYSSDVNCEKIQTFIGKYMPQWFKDPKSHGLFVALPGVNSHAKGYYLENCKNNPKITIRLLQEPDVLDALIESKIVISDDEIAKNIDLSIGKAGDSILICSDKGFFWLQLVIPVGSGIATKIQLFDSIGHPIDDRQTIDYLSELVSEIKELELILAENKISSPKKEYDENENVVELRGSSSCFEYQFPASPEFFVGRAKLLNDVDSCMQEVKTHNTSSRAILFEANSGWGKSSAVLATVDRLKFQGHYALAIDSRSASSSQFILRSVQHVIEKFGDFNGLLKSPPIVSGFDGAVNELVEIGTNLANEDRLLLIFFDQFENIFHLLEVLKRISQLCLKISDVKSNVILGFSWKTDLVGMTRDFPYRWRDTIIDSCRVFHIPQFSEVETNALLDRLAAELHTTLRKDLRFLLSEFSQGYPWLLKKLCAHVKNQRASGVAQAELARGLLNVEQLFLEDLKGLIAEEEDILRRIARNAPINISDLGDDFKPEIVQNLVNRRLVVKVATKYDIYWDIFRDYLNTGKLPVQEVYLLRAQVGSILKAINILHESEGILNVDQFKRSAGLSDGAFLNVARDLRLLDIANVENNELRLKSNNFSVSGEMSSHLRTHLNEILRRNRTVHSIIKVLTEKRQISIEELSMFLSNEFPYISAAKNTWNTYAKVLASWLDLSDLAILDDSKSYISKYEVGSQIRERTLSLSKKRTGSTVPSVHFTPVEQVAARLTTAVMKNEPVDWSGFSKSTIYKSLSMLEEMSLIARRSTTISVLPECHIFVFDKEKRIDIAKNKVLNWPVFAMFIKILEDNNKLKLTHKQLAYLIQQKCTLDWKQSTAETNAKIMLDWARHLKLAPGAFAATKRGKFKKRSKQSSLPLFSKQGEKDSEPVNSPDLKNRADD